MVALLLMAVNSKAQTGNYVFSNAEAANFSIVDLATPGGQTWTTSRSATPGYFSATMGATYTGTNDAANVNGYVKKYGNQSFTFPVGTGTDLRTLSISAPAASTEAYATSWILGDPTGNLDPTSPSAGTHAITAVTAPIVSVSSIGQWDWQVGANMGATGTGAGLSITVSIPDMSIFASASNLRLVGWNGISWIDLSGSATASGNTENNTLSGTMVSGITAIGIGSTASALPLKLENFTGTRNNCKVILNWKTAEEINTDKFMVQQGTDGIRFADVVTVTASRNSAGKAYQVTVAQLSSFGYYRLKMVDRDGSYTYSPTISMHLPCISNENINVYPNPANGASTIYVNISTAYKGSSYLTINNMAGQQVISKPVQIRDGTNIIAIKIDKLPRGTYLIALIKQDGQRIGTVQKIIK